MTEREETKTRYFPPQIIFKREEESLASSLLNIICYQNVYALLTWLAVWLVNLLSRYMPYLRNRVSLVIVSLMMAKNYGLHSTAAVEIFSGFEPLMMIKRRARWLRNTRWVFFQDMRTSTFCSIMALIPTLFCEPKKSR